MSTSEEKTIGGAKVSITKPADTDTYDISIFNQNFSNLLTGLNNLQAEVTALAAKVGKGNTKPSGGGTGDGKDDDKTPEVSLSWTSYTDAAYKKIVSKSGVSIDKTNFAFRLQEDLKIVWYSIDVTWTPAANVDGSSSDGYITIIKGLPGELKPSVLTTLTTSTPAGSEIGFSARLSITGNITLHPYGTLKKGKAVTVRVNGFYKI